jgi:GH25 family lysozyme M1 (1,4-beta-N-acetylmuramidase)
MRRAWSTLLVLVIAVLSANPAGALLTGVDVASYQHPGDAPIDWAKVRAAGHVFALIKATEATNYTNPYFAGDWTGALSAGLYRGAYHYAKPAKPFSTALDQARYFVSRAGSQTGSKDFGAVLDLEETGGLGSADLATWTRTWLAEVTRLSGKAPLLYTGYYFWNDRLGAPTDIAAGYRLWLPSYPNDPNSTTFQPLIPKGWSRWTFWQFRSDGTVPGITALVDVNRYCCDEGSLAALTGGGASGGAPFGNVEAISATPGMITADGWVVSPDSTEPVDVEVTVDSAPSRFTADLSRPDVNLAYGGFVGENHGYHAEVATTEGTHQVCVRGLGSGSIPNALLGCSTVTVPSANPFGSLDVAVTGYGFNLLTGWAIDPDTRDPIDVTVFIYNYGQQKWTVERRKADQQRTDVDAVYHSGSNHGFVYQKPRGGPGFQLACAVGMNVASGGNAFLGCKVF